MRCKTTRLSVPAYAGHGVQNNPFKQHYGLSLSFGGGAIKYRLLVMLKVKHGWFHILLEVLQSLWSWILTQTCAKTQ